MSTPAIVSPPGLVFEPDPHGYTLLGREFLSVTQALREAGLLDLLWATDADRLRGALVYRAIARYNEGAMGGSVSFDDLDPLTVPYLRGYRRFLAESALRVDGSE